MYYVLNYYQGNIDNISIGLKLLSIGAAFIVPGLLYLMLILKKTDSGLLKTCLCFSFLFASSSFLHWKNNLLVQTGIFNFSHVINVNIFSYYLFFLNAALFLPLGIIISLIKKSKTKLSLIARRQFNAIIISMIIIYGCLLMNFSLNFGMLFNFSGSFLMLLAFAMIGYAIVHFRNLEINRIIYQFLFAAFFGLPLLALHIFISIFLVGTLGYILSTTVSLAVIVFITLFAPYKKTIQNLLKRFIYQGNYDYLNVLRDVSQGLSSIIELDQLCEQLVNIISQTVSPEQVALFYADDENESYFIKSSIGIDAQQQNDLHLERENGLVFYLKENDRPLIKGELAQFEKAEIVDQLFEGVSKIAAEVVIPLKIKNRLIGFMCLSQKTSRNIYNQADIDELVFFAAEASKALEHARVYSEAIVDNLTKVFNQNYFLMRLREEIARSKRYGHLISLLFIDFKVLDNDLILKAVGLLLKTKVRNVDVLGRYSQQMFAVILPQTAKDNDDLEQAMAKHKKDTMLVAERIMQGIEEFKSIHKGKKVKLDARIGLSCFDGQDKQFTEDLFIEQAEQALAKAHRARTHKVVCFERT
jgi:diguanylate cyclase (GGDEF)-like protein